jgi:hypothetical protein
MTFEAKLHQLHQCQIPWRKVETIWLMSNHDYDDYKSTWIWLLIDHSKLMIKLSSSDPVKIKLPNPSDFSFYNLSSLKSIRMESRMELEYLEQLIQRAPLLQSIDGIDNIEFEEGERWQLVCDTITARASMWPPG